MFSLLFQLLIFTICAKTITCEPNIVIIGAGASGIAAATRLLKSNITDFVILEAEDRIGGRINSVKFGDAIVDLGAEWCHGENNLVFKMVKDMNILSLRNPDHDLRAHITVYYSNREDIPNDLSEKLLQITDDIYEQQSSLAAEKENMTLGEYCKEEYEKRVSQLNISDPIYANFIKDFVQTFEQFIASAEGSFTWNDPSAISSEIIENNGRLDWTWTGMGYKTILDILMQKYPKTGTPLPVDDKFLFNKEVEKISWDKTAGKLGISCKDNTTYEADYVIFTPSIGVLKKQHDELFEPKLPKKKIKAIENIGFGAVIKVMLLFKEAWWPISNDFSGFSFVWAEETKTPRSPEYKLGEMPWLLAMSVLIPVQSNPNVLSLWFVGPEVPDIEILDEDTLMNGINFGLDLFLGHKFNITKPISYVKSRWYTNPHFRGTYSFQTVASRKEKSNSVLAEPVANKKGKKVLLFAGESTNSLHFGTVHGAIESGFREADRILSQINNL